MKSDIKNWRSTVFEKDKKKKQEIVDALKNFSTGLTLEELAELVGDGMSGIFIITKIDEMIDEGLIQESGKRICSRTGKMDSVYKTKIKEEQIALNLEIDASYRG